MDLLDELILANKESEIRCLKPATDFVTSQSLFSINRSEVFGVEDVSKLTRNMIICVMSDCINELTILKSINLQNDLGTNSNKLPNYMSIEDRYMGQENHADYRINSTNNNFDKLAKDINMLSVVLRETCKETRKFGTYKILEETMRIVIQMHRDEEQLLEDEANQERMIEEVNARYEEERLENIRTIEETDSKIQQLKFQVEDIYIYGQQEVQYFDKWEKTRLEQNILKCKEKEQLYESTIKDMQDKIDKENRCHNELEGYFEETKNDHLDEIQYWMKKYDEEMEQREGDMLHLKTDLEKVTEERKIMSAKYAKRQAEIDDFQAYKKVREAIERQRLKEIQAVTRIQAWWRGVMVRRQLGPFSKKKKGKGKGKDKGKKK